MTGDVADSTISSATITTDDSNTTTTVALAVIEQNSVNGFGNITIPKSAIPYGTTPTVYVNNDQSPSQGFTQDAKNYYVWYSSGYPTYSLSIIFATSSVNPGFPYWVVLTIVVIAAVSLVIMFYFKKKKTPLAPAASTIKV